MAEEEASVLLEFQGLRMEINLERDRLCALIEEELLLIKREIKVAFFGDNCEASSHFIQVWSKKWNKFLNVYTVEQVFNGDVITLVAQPSVSPQKAASSYNSAQTVLNKVTPPSDVEARELVKYFPSYKKSQPVFNPGATPTNKKKRAAVVRKAKPSSVTVVVLERFRPVVPRGITRERLAREGRLLSIRLHREMTNEDVRRKISSGFKCSPDVTLLDASGGTLLCKCDDQNIDGARAVERKGALYFCEEFKANDDSNDDSNAFQTKWTRGRKRTVSLSLMDLSSSDSDSHKNLKVDLKTDRGECTKESTVTDVINLSDLERESEDELREWRKIRLEQDIAFQESLAADQAKDRIAEARDRLKLKWANAMKENASGNRFLIKLSSTKTLKASIPADACGKALYEITFAFGDLDRKFSLFTNIPRERISENLSPVDLTSLSRVLLLELEATPIDVETFSVTVNEPVHTSEVDAGKPSSLVSNEVIREVSQKRETFMASKYSASSVKHHVIKRSKVYENVMEVYTDTVAEVLDEYPLRFKFDGERGFDAGGVCRELFSCFWKMSYLKHFDGETLLVPSIFPGMKSCEMTTLGTIMSHGYLVCGFLPIRLAFPVIATALKGPNVDIPDAIMIESFLAYVSVYESVLLQEAKNNAKEKTPFPPSLLSKLIQLVSRFGCTAVPNCHNFLQLVTEVARHVFIGKPMDLLYALREGVPEPHRSFWDNLSVARLFDLYRALNANPAVVLDLLEEPEFENEDEAKVFYYLTTFIGNSKENELRSFLRFATGSSVVLDTHIKVSFNALRGLARRPISHTCNCLLELPTSYGSYLEFEKDFNSILSEEDSWTLDSV